MADEVDLPARRCTNEFVTAVGPLGVEVGVGVGDGDTVGVGVDGTLGEAVG